MKSLRTLLLVIGFSPMSAWAQFQPPTEPPAVVAPEVNPEGAKAALALVPAKYFGGVLKLTADNGTPNPPTWYLTVKKDEGEIFSIEVSGGQITKEERTLNLRALIGNPSAINLSKMAIGSDKAWEIAANYVAQKGKTLSSVSYVLQQKGADSAPVWAVWCYDKDGDSIGYLEILATDGKVIASE